MKVLNQQEKCPSCRHFALIPMLEKDNSFCYVHNSSMKRNFWLDLVMTCDCKWINSKTKVRCYNCAGEFEKEAKK